MKRRRWTRATRFGAWLFAGGLTSTAQAAPAPENAPPPRYEVERECDARPVWLSHLRERLPPLLRAHPWVATLSVHVAKIEERGAEPYYLGELASAADASLEARAVRGESCEEVLDALSFIAALGLERASTSSGTVSGHVSPTSPDLPAGATASGVEVDPLDQAGAAPRSPERLRLAAVGFALLQDGLTPGQPFAFGIALRLSWSTASWQPVLLLGAYSSLPEQHGLAGGGSVRFEHWSTHAVACPFRFPRGGAWGLRPCVDLDVGRSTGEAFDVAGAEKQAAPWLSGGAQLRAELVLGERVELVASAGMVAPFWHSHFLLLPDLETFTTPALGFRAGSSASLFF